MFFEAIFQPNRKSEYKADMKRLIGQPIPIQGGWISEEGNHKGEQCFYLATKNVSIIPASDLKDIKNISFVRWKEIHSKVQDIKDNKAPDKKDKKVQAKKVKKTPEKKVKKVQGKKAKKAPEKKGKKTPDKKDKKVPEKKAKKAQDKKVKK